MPDGIVSRILRLPGYGIYGWEMDEAANTLTLAIRQTAREPYYVCGGCGISVREVHSWTERQLRDLPWGTWAVWLRVEVHRVRCRRCGVRTERLPFVEGKVHYTARLEAVVAQDCEAAPVSRVAGQRGLPPETVRRMDKRMLRRWAAARPRPPLPYLGVDEIFLGKTDKFLTVVSDLETGEPLWVGLERKQETLDRFFAEALPPARRRAVRAVGRRITKRYRGQLQTVIEDLDLPNPVIRSHYGHGFIKQYVRDHLLLRTEAATNNVADYAVPKAIDHLSQLRPKLSSIVDTYLDVSRTSWKRSSIAGSCGPSAAPRSCRPVNVFPG